MSVDSKMTAIAGQARILSGTTVEKGLDDIATDLQSANSEVSVQSDLLDQARALLSNKVAGGSGGGSLPVGISALAAGTAVPPEDAISNSDIGYQIEHGMGKTPNFYIIAMQGGISTTKDVGYMVAASLVSAIVGDMDTIGSVSYVFSDGKLSNSVPNYYGASNALFSDTTFSVILNNSAKMKGGATYAWVCGILDGVQ